MKMEVMKRNLFKFSLLTLIYSLVVAPAALAEEDDQEALIKKMEEHGISIGRMSDDPHKNRDEVQLSEAEKLLWKTDQLVNITKPAVIRYEFERKGTMDDGFTDAVELMILKVKENGMKSAAVTFFTGDRNQEVPPNENTNGNPVLGIYLQGDVYEMDRLTEGHWRYFHRRIKFALADDATVEPVTINVDGKELKAKKVTFRPYVKDPKRKLFEDYADKIYEVYISENIPGMLYKIHTVIPGKDKEGDPLVEETLVYSGIEYEE